MPRSKNYILKNPVEHPLHSRDIQTLYMFDTAYLFLYCISFILVLPTNSSALIETSKSEVILCQHQIRVYKHQALQRGSF